MKGLILKDFYMAIKYCRFYLVITVIFAIASIYGDSAFFLFYPVLMAGIIPINLISYDEKSKWNVYAGAFPYTRREYVSVKYIVTLIFLGIGIGLIAIAQAVHMFMTGDVDWNSYVTILSVLPALGLISPCILLPTVFKLGVEKGRIVYFAVIFVVCGTFAVLGALSIDLNMGQFLHNIGSWLIPTALGIGGLLLIASWNLSAYLYQRREI